MASLLLAACRSEATQPTPKTPETRPVAAADDWKLAWSDEFNHDGPPDPHNWNFENGFVRNEELQWYQPDNARCENGLLVIEARRERKQNPRYNPNGRSWKSKREYAQYTSACLTTGGCTIFNSAVSR